MGFPGSGGQSQGRRFRNKSAAEREARRKEPERTSEGLHSEAPFGGDGFEGSPELVHRLQVGAEASDIVSVCHSLGC